MVERAVIIGDDEIDDMIVVIIHKSGNKIDEFIGTLKVNYEHGPVSVTEAADYFEAMDKVEKRRKILMTLVAVKGDKKEARRLLEDHHGIRDEDLEEYDI